ncbi:protein of unknown function [Nitrospina watsonii]|uniref:Uncharacterized protein n=1 Tax=Nitrospina watsonii TaxID=1323948 RepID=A0ABN8W0G8_9BACT|nr:protein of unknown function [Nitrospina watsonii]
MFVFVVDELRPGCDPYFKLKNQEHDLWKKNVSWTMVTAPLPTRIQS